MSPNLIAYGGVFIAIGIIGLAIYCVTKGNNDKDNDDYKNQGKRER